MYAQDENRTQHPFASFTQIADDWKSYAYTSIKVVNGGRCPDDHPEPVIYKVWQGLHAYCDCQDSEEGKNNMNAVHKETVSWREGANDDGTYNPFYIE